LMFIVVLRVGAVSLQLILVALSQLRGRAIPRPPRFLNLFRAHPLVAARSGDHEVAWADPKGDAL